MKKIKRLLITLLFFTLSSCTNPFASGEGEGTSANSNTYFNNGNTDSVLSHIFEKSDFNFSEKYEIISEAEPLYDEVKNELTFLCEQEFPYTDENGDECYGSRYLRVTTDLTGTVQAENEICSFEEMRNIKCAAITETAALFCFFSLDTSYQQVYSLMLVHEEEISESESFFEIMENTYIEDAVLMTDDTPILLIWGDVFCLDKSLNVQFSVSAGARSLSIYHDELYCGGKKIDLITQTTEELPWNSEENYDSIWHYGNGYSAYIQSENGLYGCHENEAPEMVMSFENSDLINRNVEIMKILDEETILLSDSGAVSIYRKVSDVDLSNIIILDLAYTDADDLFKQRVVEFNHSHPEIRIVSRQYETEEALFTDIITGVYRPDIVTADSSDNTEINKIIEEGIYTDLYPLIENSKTINMENILGCVKRTYQTENGELAAITNIFQVETVIGTKESLGNRTSWTAAEMVDYASKLPEGTELMSGLTKRSAVNRIFGNVGYAAFVDIEAGRCFFNTEDFVEYLEFVKKLPDKVEPESYLRSVTAEKYVTGKLALARITYKNMAEYLQEEYIFQTQDYVRIGYPSGGSFTGGSYINASPYVITSFCDDPEAAWSFLEEVLFEETIGQNKWNMANGFPALKSQLRELCEESKNYVYKYYLDGSYMFASSSAENSYDFSMDSKEGNVRYYMDKDGTELELWLDENVGIPLCTTISTEITEIVNEEISSYLEGIKEAALCANIIQSRVSLWLSEHEG